VRRFVDPIKDLTAEIMEIRSGLKTLSRARRTRPGDRTQLQEIARINGQLNALDLVLDTDPRRVNDMGALNAAVGLIGGADRLTAGK
jgi:capsid protein